MTKTLALFLTATGILSLGGTVVAAGIALLFVHLLAQED